MSIDAAKWIQRDLIRIATAGSVDDGKSTLLGRLLYDCNCLFEDQIGNIQKFKNADGTINYAYLLDGLGVEQEQGITIDVAYRYFSTSKRQYILADSPGHEQYTRNMVTATSLANISIIILDASRGVQIQSKRHAFIASLLKVPRVVVCVNKMDLVNWDQEIFDRISEEYKQFLGQLEIREITFIPICATLGDNIAVSSINMPWYQGSNLINYLDSVYIQSDYNPVDFRLPVQMTLMYEDNKRMLAGRVASGTLRKGEVIRVCSNNQIARVIKLLKSGVEVDQVTSDESVSVSLDKEIDVSRGDMLCKENNVAYKGNLIEAMLVWMDTEPLSLKKTYIVKHTTNKSRIEIEKLVYRLNINNLSKEQNLEELKLNEIGRVLISSHHQLFFDDYQKNRITGSFILIDEISNSTVAAGTIITRVPIPLYKQENYQKTNILESKSSVSKSDRIKLLGHRPLTIWLTGLSGSGKSAISMKVEEDLIRKGIQCIRLDGDNFRLGLSKDLGFSARDRQENIRRVAEVSKLFNDAGLVVITSLISPFEKDRKTAREIIGKDLFCEIFVDCPLEVCEKRDPKGLYKKVRANEIKEFTGINSPYEKPLNPALTLNTNANTVEYCVLELLEHAIKIIKS